mgnify:CR=1 FL=1
MQSRESLGECSRADTGLTEIERIVLATTAQYLDGALHFERAADQRIDLARLRPLVEIGGVLLERGTTVRLTLAVRRRLILGSLLVRDFR